MVSFVGFVPYENPRFVCLVMIDDATKLNGLRNYGGTIAAPIFARVSGRVAHYMNIMPAEAIAQSGDAKPQPRIAPSGEVKPQQEVAHGTETKQQQEEHWKQQWVQIQQEGGRR